MPCLMEVAKRRISFQWTRIDLRFRWPPIGGGWLAGIYSQETIVCPAGMYVNVQVGHLLESGWTDGMPQAQTLLRERAANRPRDP